jgi:ABC-type multidrug transport system fused ATPase/permease subunit
MKDPTTLVIAHRLSTVEKADCIIVLDREGHYASLYNLQFSE